MKKRFLSILITFSMVLSLVPMNIAMAITSTEVTIAFNQDGTRLEVRAAQDIPSNSPLAFEGELFTSAGVNVGQPIRGSSFNEDVALGYHNAERNAWSFAIAITNPVPAGTLLFYFEVTGNGRIRITSDGEQDEFDDFFELVIFDVVVTNVPDTKVNVVFNQAGDRLEVRAASTIPANSALAFEGELDVPENMEIVGQPNPGDPIGGGAYSASTGYWNYALASQSLISAGTLLFWFNVSGIGALKISSEGEDDFYRNFVVFEAAVSNVAEAGPAPNVTVSFNQAGNRLEIKAAQSIPALSRLGFEGILTVTEGISVGQPILGSGLGNNTYGIGAYNKNFATWSYAMVTHGVEIPAGTVLLYFEVTGTGTIRITSVGKNDYYTSHVNFDFTVKNSSDCTQHTGVCMEECANDGCDEIYECGDCEKCNPCGVHSGICGQICTAKNHCQVTYICGNCILCDPCLGPHTGDYCKQRCTNKPYCEEFYLCGECEICLGPCTNHSGICMEECQSVDYCKEIYYCKTCSLCSSCYPHGGVCGETCTATEFCNVTYICYSGDCPRCSPCNDHWAENCTEKCIKKLFCEEIYYCGNCILCEDECSDHTGTICGQKCVSKDYCQERWYCQSCLNCTPCPGHTGDCGQICNTLTHCPATFICGHCDICDPCDYHGGICGQKCVTKAHCNVTFTCGNCNTCNPCTTHGGTCGQKCTVKAHCTATYFCGTCFDCINCTTHWAPNCLDICTTTETCQVIYRCENCTECSPCENHNGICGEKCITKSYCLEIIVCGHCEICGDICLTHTGTICGQVCNNKEYCIEIWYCNTCLSCTPCTGHTGTICGQECATFVHCKATYICENCAICRPCTPPHGGICGQKCTNKSYCQEIYVCGHCNTCNPCLPGEHKGAVCGQICNNKTYCQEIYICGHCEQCDPCLGCTAPVCGQECTNKIHCKKEYICGDCKRCSPCDHAGTTCGQICNNKSYCTNFQYWCFNCDNCDPCYNHKGDCMEKCTNKSHCQVIIKCNNCNDCTPCINHGGICGQECTNKSYCAVTYVCENCGTCTPCTNHGGTCGQKCTNKSYCTVTYICENCETCTPCTNHEGICGQVCTNKSYCIQTYICGDCTNCTSDCNTCTKICATCDGCRECRKDTLYSDCGCTNCTACNCYRLGDINNDGSITITDALQILMKLAKIPSCLINTDTKARRASLIVSPVANPTTTDNPTISDALQVLMKLATITSSIVDGSITGRNRLDNLK